MPNFTATVTVYDVGTVTIHTDGVPDTEGRIPYRCTIFAVYADAGGEGRTIYRGHGIRTGVGDSVDLTGALATTLGFINHDGDLYRSCMGDWIELDDDHAPSFDRVVAEWAYMHDTELADAELQLRGRDL